MSRSTLTSIISQVRDLIGDPAGATQTFTDDHIQAALDQRRSEARYARMVEQPTIQPGGTTTYLTFDAPVGWWESGVVLTDASYNVLAPASSDLTNGRWVFAAEPSLPVLVSGFTHDVYGAAADLLEEWATREARSFDVSADGVDLKRSQKATQLHTQAMHYLAKARPRTAQLVRTDEARC